MTDTSISESVPSIKNYEPVTMITFDDILSNRIKFGKYQYSVKIIAIFIK